MSNETTVITYKQAKSQINTLGISLFMYIVMMTVVRYAFILRDELFPAGINIFMINVILYGGFLGVTIFSLLPFLISSKVLNLKLKDYFKPTKIKIGTFISYVCIGIAIQLTVSSILTLVGLVPSNNIYPQEFIGVFTSQEAIIINVVYFILMVIVKPICDEIVFRGVIQRKLGHFSRSFGVIASAFLYGLAQTSFADFLPAFFLGMFLSMLCLKYHSVKPAMKVQIGIALFFILINYIPSQFYTIVLGIIVMVYIIVTFGLFNRLIKLPNLSSRAFEKDLWVMMLSSFSITLCMVIQAASYIVTWIMR
ncbi:MAG: CPBP family intramembrane metalloprotease [Erysipelotrichaceae bacterium]|nr:CPBP family intramembrane metalloprotease [Erysipelotrichaceae bacterium]MDY5251719.1 CPBP family intramembrane glutamic endopeptidase [Erysipelotrichaceae bacterium]